MSAAAAPLPVRQPWFATMAHPDQITQITEPHVDPFLRSNLWHVRGRDHDLLIDTGMGMAPLPESLPGVFGREPIVFVTHGHFDHTGGAHEFSDVRCHVAEVAALKVPEESSLDPAELGQEFADALAADSPGGVAPPYLVDAVPDAEYDVTKYDVVPVAPSQQLQDGERIDLGDRTFEVVHLPGHTPGSAGLYERDTGILFSGDVVYDGELLDELPESNIEDYVNSMRRLAEVGATVVHAGHEDSFGAERLAELIDGYLSRRASSGARR